MYKINIGKDLGLSLNKIENLTLLGYGNYGYYYLSNDCRFGFSENKIDEIAIDFSEPKSSILMFEGHNYLNFTKSKIYEG